MGTARSFVQSGIGSERNRFALGGRGERGGSEDNGTGVAERDSRGVIERWTWGWKSTVLIRLEGLGGRSLDGGGW